MPTRARFNVVIFAALLCCTSGCGGGSTTRASLRPMDLAQARAASGHAQRPGTREVSSPHVHIPTGDWTATETILETKSVDACAGERLVCPWDFRRLCKAGKCKTYLYTMSYYGVEAAEVVANGRGGYVAKFPPSTVPCPHRRGEDAGTNESRGTITIRWSDAGRTLRGIGRKYQEGACGGGPPDTSRYVATRDGPDCKSARGGPVDHSAVTGVARSEPPPSRGAARGAVRRASRRNR